MIPMEKFKELKGEMEIYCKVADALSALIELWKCQCSEYIAAAGRGQTNSEFVSICFSIVPKCSLNSEWGRGKTILFKVKVALPDVMKEKKVLRNIANLFVQLFDNTASFTHPFVFELCCI